MLMNFLDKIMRNPADSFSSNFCIYMSDEEFPKVIMMHVLRAKIALNFHRTEETNFGLDSEYSPTLNRKNKAMAGMEETYCEHTTNLVVNDHIDLGEERF